MSISDEMIEKAVEVVWECGPWTDQESLRIVRALAQSGLLAAAPLREEWGARWDDGTLVMAHYLSEEEARIGAGDDPVVHRWATEWEPCDG